MNMIRKSTLSAAVALVFMASVGSANAYTGSETYPLTVTGTVESNPCVVTVPSTLDLGTTNADSVKSTGATNPTGGTIGALSINISNCADNQMAQLKITGTADASDTTVLANATSAGSATNVGVAFWKMTGDHEQVKVNGAPLAAISANGNMMNLLAKVVKTGTDAVEPGTIDATATIQIDFL